MDARRRCEELDHDLRALQARFARDRRRARLPLLARVEIATPCDARWEDMDGDDRVRHCGACDRDVFDLSACTTREAEALLQRHGVAAARGACGHLVRREDGTVLAGDCPVGIRRRWRAAVGRAARAATRGAAIVIALATPLVLAALAFLPTCVLSRLRQARTDAMTVRSAAEMYLAEDPSARCPTVADLVSTRVLNSSARTTDPWGDQWRISCDGDEVTVTSDRLGCEDARADVAELCRR